MYLKVQGMYRDLKVQGIQNLPKGSGFLGGGQTHRHTDKQTNTHQYHDSAWPRGRAE